MLSLLPYSSVVWPARDAEALNCSGVYASSPASSLPQPSLKPVRSIVDGVLGTRDEVRRYAVLVTAYDRFGLLLFCSAGSS